MLSIFNLMRNLCLLPLLVALSASVLAQEERQVGVVVEAVTPHGAADRVGLREGDLIQKWERGSAKGAIESPFDLTELEIDQAPLGIVTLEGQRDGQQQHWSMGLDEWGLQSRPVFTEALLKLYQEGRERETAGAHVEAAQRWLAAGTKSQDSAVPWLSPWFLRRTSDSLARTHRKKRSDEIYREAVERAANSKPIISMQLLQSWANACQQQNDWDHAQQHYKQSLMEGQKWNMETLGNAASLQGLGKVSEQRGHLALAEEYYNQALRMREKLAPESLPVAGSLSDIGILSLKRGDPNHAEEYVRRALAIREKLVPESLDVAASFKDLGKTFIARGDLAKAQEYFSRALEIRERITPGSLDVASSLNNLGSVFGQGGDLAKGEEYLSRALAIQEQLAPGSLEVAFSLNNLSNILGRRGDLVRCEEYLRRALAIEKKLAPGGLDVALALNNLGNLSFRRGDLAKTEQYYNRALSIEKERAPGSPEVAYFLGNLGKVVSQRGDLRKAEKYLRQALGILEKLAPGSLEVADELDGIGALFNARDDLVKATQYYHQSLVIRGKLAPESLDVATSLNNLGEASYKGGDLVKAEQYYTQAQAIIERLSPGSSIDAEVLVALAKIYRRRQKLNIAAGLLEHALSAIEHQTSRLGGTVSERAHFRSKYVNYYKDYVDVLLAQNRPELAFQVLERSRARSFLQLLAERDLVFAADLPHEIRQARQENGAAYDRTQAQIAQLSLQRDGAQIEQLQQHLRDLEAEREEIAERARQSSPRFAALQYPQPLDLEAVRVALDPGTALLSYSVSEDHTVLFVVRPAGERGGLSVFDLKVTEKKLRRLIEELRKLVQQGREAAGAEAGRQPVETRDATLTAHERELYALLLEPAESIIASSERVLLIPDGPLQILPFAALKLKSGQYLVEWKPAHTAVSATVYAELKRVRPTKYDKSVDVAAFGDPLYPLSAQAAVKGNQGDTVDGEVRSAIERGFALSRLPFSRTEVQSIVGLFAGHELQFLGEQATEEHAKALGKDVRYIHFATHGLLDERFPLNSSLVLTIPSKSTEGQENGLLQAWEVFEQVRLDADLVTLSACSTGLGQELNGEGLMGLTRAFQYAGARSVLASLWNVDDYRTMQLMHRFYAELHAGASKDAALRAAQLQLLHSSAKDPFYWAAFSLAGDWD